MRRDSLKESIIDSPGFPFIYARKISSSHRLRRQESASEMFCKFLSFHQKLVKSSLKAFNRYLVYHSVVAATVTRFILEWRCTISQRIEGSKEVCLFNKNHFHFQTQSDRICVIYFLPFILSSLRVFESLKLVPFLSSALSE